MTPPEMALALLIPALLLLGLWLLPSEPLTEPSTDVDEPIPGPKPTAFDKDQALRLVGWEGRVHRNDVVAAVHPDMGQATLYAQVNADRYGHPTVLFPFQDGTVLGVVDLRPALAALGVEPTPL